MFIEMFKPRFFWEAEDETGTGSLVGDDTGDDTAPAGDDTGDDTAASGDEGKKTLIGSDDDAPDYDFDTLVEPDAFKEALGDDFEIADEDAFNKFLDTVNNATSREELARELLNVYSESLETAAQATAGVFEETQTQWQEQVKTDATYGGDNLDQSLANAKSVAMEYGGKEFLQLLNLTGAGNNLAMVAFLNKVHAAMPKEGTPVAGTPTQASRSLAERLFPSAEGN